MRDPGLGGDDDALTRNAFDRLADDRLGAVHRGGVEEIDAQVQGLADEGDGFGRALAGAKAEPAEPAAAKTGDADGEPSPAEWHVFHDFSRYTRDIRGAEASERSLSVISSFACFLRSLRISRSANGNLR